MKSECEYGTVKRVHIPTDRDTGRVRGFAFVEMESEADEDKAIEALDGAEWMERSLKVNKARQERKQKLLWWWSSKQPFLSKDSVKSKNQRF